MGMMGRWRPGGWRPGIPRQPVPPQAQKKNYRQEKKRASRELLSALTDPRVVIMADSLKVGTLGA